MGGSLIRGREHIPSKTGSISVHQWRRKGGSEREKGGAKDKEKKYEIEGGRTYINEQARLQRIERTFYQEYILF